jgi:hypothetical protein
VWRSDAADDVFIAGVPIFKITPDGVLNAFAGVLEGAERHPCGNALRASVYATGSLSENRLFDAGITWWKNDCDLP